MLPIITTRTILIPKGVKVKSRTRKIKISGPRGCLSRNFSHTIIKITTDQKKIYLTLWHGNRKKTACLNTISSHISNLIFGVVYGFQYRMKMVYAHFPINLNIIDEGKGVEIRNFLGEKRVRKIFMSNDVLCEKNESSKDEIILKGNDLSLVSMSASAIQQSCLVKNKDIRKFLDGIYVSEKEKLYDSILN